MKKYLNILSKTRFFQGMSEENIDEILTLYLCFFKQYHTGELIYATSSNIRYAGIILEGTVDILHPSPSGNDTIVNRLIPGQMFGESFACLDTSNALSEIRSISDSLVLLIDIRRLLECEACNPRYRLVMMNNIMRSLAESNVLLNTKIQLLTQKTLREKLLSYFHILATQYHSNEFDIPFNREQLACFLASERSSICRELSRMRDEGLIELHGKHVIMLTF